ncbi:MAG: RNA polymerase sigma factor [Armatimonas sp.]
MRDSVEEALVQRARGGDNDAFARLCEQHRRRVWHTVASVTRRPADADDLAQEAIVKAYKSLGAYRGDAPFSAWLCRIALNAAHDHQKSAWKRKVLFWHQHPSGDRPDEPDDSALSLDDEALLRDRQRRVRAAVAELNERERSPIWLIYFEEYSLAEVARLEGVPESTIRSRVKAGLRRLQTRLGDLAPGLDDEDTSLEENSSQSSGTPLMKGCTAR